MRPLSLPAAGSIAAFDDGWLAGVHRGIDRTLQFVGVVTWTPTPPNASIILS